ncbi:hypothetical protein G4B88_009585 [Cannabis sativa]|uniref:Uncharacterized protein n=1 Tax=Cannabis sativa TaxID=3483 RepID=A0A7J6GEL3_CANSA|nr:hypothetical protein G4B88_009585 [Cannabis sativa]
MPKLSELGSPIRPQIIAIQRRHPKLSELQYDKSIPIEERKESFIKSEKKKRNENEVPIDRFKGCCFGFLLDMDESLQPANMIIHSLLLHQRHTDNKIELELSFEDKKATFGLDEFAPITGLNCSQLPKHDDDDAIKMAKMFTVINILESNRGSTAVDEFIMKLVGYEPLIPSEAEKNSLSVHCVKTPTLNKEKDKSVDIPLTMPTEKHTNTSQKRSIDEEIFELPKDVKGEKSVVKKDTDEMKKETANVKKGINDISEIKK